MTPEPEAIDQIEHLTRRQAIEELQNILQHMYSFVPAEVLEACGADTFAPAGVRPLHIRIMRLLSDATWPCACEGCRAVEPRGE